MSHSDSNSYRAKGPYPTVDLNGCHNEYYASLLLDDYAEGTSELTAITQYIYGHVLAEEPEITDTFLGVAIVEMSHLDMLADVIKELGYNPKFWSGTRELWNSSYVQYGYSTKNRLELAIKSEYEAIAQYRSHIRKIHNEQIDALLERIIKDEEYHIMIFEGLLHKYY